MIAPPEIILDPRETEEVVRQLLARRLGYVPEWFVGEAGGGRALIEVVARYQQAVSQRLNRAPDKNKLAFLGLLGLALVPAQAARAPIVFQLTEQAADSRVPANTQVAAPPPPEQSGQMIFETERAVGLASGKLIEVVSLWPGRDQYLDHSEALKNGQSFRLFEKLKLKNIPHVLYLAHDIHLALAGNAHVTVEFELAQPGSAPLEIVWEYWDGKVWRAFKGMRPACQGVAEQKDDGTTSLTRNGEIHLRSECAETKKTKVNLAGFALTEASLADLQSQALPEDVLEQLAKLKGERIAGENSFLKAVELKIGATATNSFKSSILKAAEKGIEAFWIRGVLSQPLPPDPTMVLPEVDQIRLRTDIQRPLQISIQPRAEEVHILGKRLTVRAVVVNEAGGPVSRAFAEITGPEGAKSKEVKKWTGADGIVELGNASAGLYRGRISFADQDVPFEATYAAVANVLQFAAQIDVAGLEPDKAFANETKVDVTSPFYPFGQQPQPGSTFYFTSEEAFSKPGAKLQIYIARAPSPQDKLSANSPAPESEDPPIPGVVALSVGSSQSVTPLDHLVSWEYWNGRQWVTLLTSSIENDGVTGDLNKTEIIDLTVPNDMVKTKVNEQEALWMRVRLVSGGFGFVNEVIWTDPHSNSSENKFSYVIAQPPAVAAFRLGYTWTNGPVPPQHVWTYNDFQYEDRTYEATWPGKTFSPFARVHDLTPALYLGFDKKLPVDRLALYFDLLEHRGDTLGPEMVWEHWDGANWRELSMEDETQRLRVPGMLSFIGAEDSQARARFGLERYWLRGRLKEDVPPGEPLCAGIFPNAVWVSQLQTFNNVTLGTSTGQMNQVFRFSQIPVLEGAQVEVQELRGLRANVEWRILVREIAPTNQRLIAEFEELLGREGSETDLELAGLRLRRDRNKRVVEAWVRWQERPHFFSSQPEDRHFTIDRASGRIRFGNGTLGKIPSAGATILARRFRAGGGKVGNVAVRTIRQLLGGVAGVQSVFNPRPAEGGADGETLERFRERGPRTVRHRGRAIAPQDYETLAYQASPAVAAARAVPTRNPTGQPLPGWVTLILIPESQEPRPWPSFGLREKVRRFVEARAPADAAAAHRLYVTGPDYLAVDVSATIAPLNHGSDVGAVERQARASLQEFLHPLHGGPERRGWLPGRSVFLSDVAAVLERVGGVDYVEELALFLEGNRQGASVWVAEDRVVVAGEIHLKLKSGEA